MRNIKKVLVTVVAVAAVSVAGMSTYLLTHSFGHYESEYSKSIEVHLSYFTHSSLDDLTENSDYIFVGTIKGGGKLATAAETGQEHILEELQTPFTDFSVRVDEVIKGDILSRKTITFRQIGGISDGVRHYVANFPSLRDSQQYIFFAIEGDGIFGGLAGGYAVAPMQKNTFSLPEEVGITEKTTNISDVRVLPKITGDIQ